jgi:ATP-dependent RNA helicase RhlE
MVSPEEEGSLRDIERVIGRRLPRVTVPDFEYTAQPQALEMPRAQRIAQIRQRKQEDRQRAQVNAARRASAQRGPAHDGNVRQRPLQHRRTQ